jgi:ankyrin repeat protein
VTSDLNTPLHGAAREGHAEVCGMLIDKYANKTAINKVRKMSFLPVLEKAAINVMKAITAISKSD